MKTIRTSSMMMVAILLTFGIIVRAQDHSQHKPAAKGADSSKPAQHQMGGQGGMMGGKGGMMGGKGGMMGGKGGMMGGKGGMMGGNSGMMDHCKEMMAKKAKMMTEMKASSEKLDALAKTMNTTTGTDKVEAMAAVINEMVTERSSMHQKMAAMDADMMKHMMEHMSSGKQSMMNCPMMQGMHAGGAKADEHSKHH